MEVTIQGGGLPKAIKLTFGVVNFDQSQKFNKCHVKIIAMSLLFFGLVRFTANNDITLKRMFI